MPDLANLYAGHPFWAWIAVAAALLAAEVATGSGWLLWPSASAAVTAVAARALRLGFAEALLLFAVLTIISTLLGRRLFPRGLLGHGHDINDNVARLVGHHGRVVAGFRDRAGRVFIDGKEWAAELEDGEAPAAGQPVEVVGVNGARLRVRGLPAAP